MTRGSVGTRPSIGFLTNTAPGGPGARLADFELRHRRHARVEDRIRAGNGHKVTLELVPQDHDGNPFVVADEIDVPPPG